jgi:hypothetical protein
MGVALDTPFFTEQSIRSVNFFNNRLLSAEDLNAEKDANRAEHKQLGRGLGDGILRGLEVSVQDESMPSLKVARGLAVNRNGRAFELPDDTVVMLSVPSRANGNSTAGAEFEECEPPRSGVYILNEGVYLLTIKPTETGEGRAPVSGLSGGAAGCNVKSRVSAVRFRMISLDDQLNQQLSDLQAALNAATPSTLAAERIRQKNRLRNRVAYACFGSGDARLDSFVRDPFGATATDYGLLANLRQLSDTNVSKLTNCEVPLAIVYWTNAGLQWVDMWSVRRRLTTSDPSGFVWPMRADRRISEGEAMFLQFQEQIEDIRTNETGLAPVEATQWFAYLPPAGLLPLGGSRNSIGFDAFLFFQNLTTRNIVFIEGAKVGPLFGNSLSYLPIDLSTKELIWLYLVRENVQTINASASYLSQPCLIFARGQIPYQANARYDVVRWDYGNYALEKD